MNVPSPVIIPPPGSEHLRGTIRPAVPRTLIAQDLLPRPEDSGSIEGLTVRVPKVRIYGGVDPGKPGCAFDMKRNFASDNNSGITPECLAAITEANSGHAPAYGNDEWTRQA